MMVAAKPLFVVPMVFYSVCCATPHRFIGIEVVDNHQPRKNSREMVSVCSCVLCCVVYVCVSECQLAEDCPFDIPFMHQDDS
ncbi:hypothetical protein BDF19DRAFT_439577 [Syncephalis fuscata]|nr:hypothetical protein BDF19DRAFT_439577 [Syncephalis fuscata]